MLIPMRRIEKSISSSSLQGAPRQFCVGHLLHFQPRLSPFFSLFSLFSPLSPPPPNFASRTQPVRHVGVPSLLCRHRCEICSPPPQLAPTSSALSSSSRVLHPWPLRSRFDDGARGSEVANTEATDLWSAGARPCRALARHGHPPAPYLSVVYPLHRYGVHSFFFLSLPFQKILFAHLDGELGIQLCFCISRVHLCHLQPGHQRWI